MAEGRKTEAQLRLRLAELEPSCVIFLTGPRGELGEDEAPLISKPKLQRFRSAAESRVGMMIEMSGAGSGKA